MTLCCYCHFNIFDEILFDNKINCFGVSMKFSLAEFMLEIMVLVELLFLVGCWLILHRLKATPSKLLKTIYVTCAK